MLRMELEEGRTRLTCMVKVWTLIQNCESAPPFKRTSSPTSDCACPAPEALKTEAVRLYLLNDGLKTLSSSDKHLASNVKCRPGLTLLAAESGEHVSCCQHQFAAFSRETTDVPLCCSRDAISRGLPCFVLPFAVRLCLS